MNKNQKGFTVVELLIAMAMSLTILAAARVMYVLQAHTVKAQETQMEAEEYARVTLDMMAREMRNLGYFPKLTACASPANTKGIVTATATSINFAYDADGNGDCAGTVASIGTSENITYTYDAAAKDITRTADGSAQTLTNGNVSAFQLIYYPRKTGGTEPAPYCSSTGVPSGCSGTLSTNLGNVQRVYVSLTVDLKRTDARVGGQHSVAMNSSINLRNH
jgi:prepilin-type N-terminal cleavage/methylation domain-containing protein